MEKVRMKLTKNEMYLIKNALDAVLLVCNGEKIKVDIGLDEESRENFTKLLDKFKIITEVLYE
jgi:hypothetical protein